jgi:hypothetical protein
MVKEELLLVSEAVALLRLRGPQNFARFARRHGIPLVRFGARVRVRRIDIDRFVLASLCVPNITEGKESFNEQS